ncbi:MAG: DNA-binding response regulator [Thermobacillus sp.]|uniref:Response regulator with CheY-like receiver domain and winged-helix DNA-binding domain n=1 Tax=Thermobacillus composti (strain DSM 18247 / JCM 13945 / KWC4) TaxID=717605 RepID=L0EC92_THECK|nr:MULTISPECIES: response regulator transcription factor [Thermobacillus]AGA57863.1 response regulator with CheY-like receiver domain and winged-helix DNA-binding domain [Thermobacillus composti KWC4]REK56799.1 MAG: DNA-binding response regulator [Thermobacillus sp.]
MNERLLVIEDETSIARILQLELEHEGYTVGRAEDGRKGLEMALSGEWDLVLLDVMLPGLNGIEVLRRIRSSGSQIPVVLLTARDTVPDKVSGFETGANDYITKPFAMEELLARVRNLLRIFQQKQAEGEKGDVLKAADLTIELRTRKVYRKEIAVELTPREFDLLVYLAEHKNQEKTREQILSDVWGYDFVGETNLVDVYIRYLRQKIDRGFRTKLIHTIRGVGYMLKEPEA